MNRELRYSIHWEGSSFLINEKKESYHTGALERSLYKGTRWVMLTNEGKASTPDVGITDSQCQALCKGDKLTLAKWRAWPDAPGRKETLARCHVIQNESSIFVCSRILLYCNINEYVYNLWLCSTLKLGNCLVLVCHSTSGCHREGRQVGPGLVLWTEFDHFLC